MTAPMPKRLPEHVSAVLPKSKSVFVISPVKQGWRIEVFFAGHLTEVLLAISYPEARRIASRLTDEGASGFVEGAA